MSKELPYWERRQAQRMFEHMESAEKVADEIAELYIKATRYLDTSIDDIFERYKAKHYLTDEEAARLLEKLPDNPTIEELKRELRSKSANKNKRELLEELESPAYQARINRLQNLRNEMDQVMTNIYRQERKESASHYINLAGDAYYKSIFDMQQRTGLGFSFSAVDSKTIDRIVNSKWSGKNYSERIWRNTTSLAEIVKRELLLGLITGKTNREVSKDIEIKFATGASDARRLVRTESNYLCGQINMESYKAVDVTKYRFVATLDLRTSKICRELDGKVFWVKEQMPGVNCNPMHPWCRSTTIAEFDAELMEELTRKATDPVTGKTITVPANMTYSEWYRKYVEGNPAAQIEEKKIHNKSSDRKQHERYRKLLDNNIPEKLDDFQEIKYNDIEKWKALQHEYRIVKQYNVVEGNVPPEKIIELHELLNREIDSFKGGFGKYKGNVAIVQCGNKILVSHSSVQNKNNIGYGKYNGSNELVLLRNERQFVAKEVGGYPRHIDSEAKLFEYLNSEYGNKEITLYMSTKLPMCDSCKCVMKQYQLKNPSVKVNVIERKDKK